MDRPPPTDALDVWAVAADEYRHGAESLLRLAFLASGDAGTAIVAVEDSFVRLLRRRPTATSDRARARRALRRSVLAACGPVASGPAGGPVPDSPAFDDDDDERIARATTGAVRALPRRQRDAVLLRCFAGLDDRAIAAELGHRVGEVRRDLERGLTATVAAAGLHDGGAIAEALAAGAAALASAPPAWEAIAARALAVRRRRQRRLLVTATASAAAVLLVVTALPHGGHGRGQRLALDGRIGAPLTTVPATLPAIVAVLADGRVLQVDGTDGRVTSEVGALAAPGGPLALGTVDLAVTRSKTYAAVRGPAPTVVTLDGARGGAVAVAAGHSPAPAADGQLAWVQHDGGADVAIVVRRSDSERRWHLTRGSAAAEPGATISWLSWAPDGRRLAFELDIAGAPPAVRVLDTETTTTLLDAPRLGPWRSPRWLADGDLVVLDVTGTLVSIVDPDSMQALSNRLDGLPAAGVDADTRGDLLAVHTDGALTVNGRAVLTGVVAAAWRP